MGYLFEFEEEGGDLVHGQLHRQRGIVSAKLPQQREQQRPLDRDMSLSTEDRQGEGSDGIEAP